MSHPIPCGLEDDRCRLEPETDEPESPLTLVEKEISWVCDSWREALEIDTAEEWGTVRHELFGARQALIHCPGHWDAYRALDDLASIAFENTIACIRAGRFEGAKK